MPRLNPEALTFGTYTSSYPPAEQVIQSAQGLEALGFDHVWSGDQLQFQHPHQLWRPDLCDGARTNPKLAAKFALQPLMSVLGQHTKRVCIGQGVLDAIRRGPAILAQEFLTTHHFTQGRAIFVLAAGEWKNIGPYGYSHKLRDSRLVETVQLVRAFLDTQEPIDFDGRFWKLDGAVVELPPYDGVPPPLWVAGGGPKVLEAVGRFADGWLVYTPGAVRGRTETIAERLATVREHAERAGRDPRRITCGTLPLMLCHPDPDKLELWLDHPFMQWHSLTGFPFGEAWRDYGYEHPLGDRYSITLEGNMATMPLERALELCRQVPRDMVKNALYCGAAADVAPRLIAEVEAGVRHFALCNYVGFLSRADAPRRRWHQQRRASTRHGRPHPWAGRHRPRLRRSRADPGAHPLRPLARRPVAHPPRLARRATAARYVPPPRRARPFRAAGGEACRQLEEKGAGLAQRIDVTSAGRCPVTEGTPQKDVRRDDRQDRSRRAKPRARRAGGGKKLVREQMGEHRDADLARRKRENDAALRRSLPNRAAAIASLVFVHSAIQGMFCWTATRAIRACLASLSSPAAEAL